MITSIEGRLAAASPLRAVVEVNGFGYEVNVPLTTAEKLPAPGAPVKLHTLVVYREDAQTLFGFASPAERDFFRLMLENVTGVGPKLALSIMSRLSLPLLEAAIRAGDVATLAQCQGIGRKTAERLIIEMRDRLAAPELAGAGGASPEAEAYDALVALGYRPAEATRLLKAAGPGTQSTEELIRRALQGAVRE
ncbi:MAG TPA: Holliday junction branch migration protein RuvA [Steroidobacteraceae bacterium]|nr:Holliday junction branch migration protein RuvA [Steroidobacteraceae bacterium]